LHKIELKQEIIKDFVRSINDKRDLRYIDHELVKILTQRIYSQTLGYEDCNDAEELKIDPIIEEAVGGELCSQPTLSRIENSIDKNDIYKISEYFVDQYIKGLSKDTKEIIIDVDGTDDPAHGNQQLALYNGYYGQYMYNELLFIDGKSGEIILPVLRPGNCHSNRWFVKILRRIVNKIRIRFKDVSIIIRADAGFSGAEFYELAEEQDLRFCIGITKNDRLWKEVEPQEKEIREKYLDKQEKHHIMVGPIEYKAESWKKSQKVYAKIESTGKGMNVRFICSNLEDRSADDLYYKFYVQRGESCENRIKEVKNMCYSDRLSCQKYLANYFRLFIASIVYEFYRQIKLLIIKTKDEEAKKWQIDNIRLYLMKIGAMFERKVRVIYIHYSKAFARKELFTELILNC
jgi:Transposase DDE domain.